MKLISVKTKQQWNDVVGKAIREGYSQDRLKENCWNDHKEKSVIRLGRVSDSAYDDIFSDRGYSSISFYKDEYPTLKIISAEEYLKPDMEGEIILRSKKMPELMILLLDGEFTMFTDDNEGKKGDEGFIADNDEYVYELYKLLKVADKMGGFKKFEEKEKGENKNKKEILI